MPAPVRSPARGADWISGGAGLLALTGVPPTESVASEPRHPLGPTACDKSFSVIGFFRRYAHHDSKGHRTDCWRATGVRVAAQMRV